MLGFTSLLADNISSNVIGLGLGTLFRFTFYRMWVFAPHRGEPEPALFPEAGPAPDGRSSLARLVSASPTLVVSSGGRGLLLLPSRRNRIEAALHQVVQRRLHEVGVRDVAQHHRMLEPGVDQHVAAAEHLLQPGLAHRHVVAAAVQQLLPDAHEEAAAQHDAARRDRVVAAEPGEQRARRTAARRAGPAPRARAS